MRQHLREAVQLGLLMGLSKTRCSVESPKSTNRRAKGFRMINQTMSWLPMITGFR